MRRLGSLYAGVGGLDVGVEWALGASTAWQLDTVGAAVRARHMPDAKQIEDDIRNVDPSGLPPVDVLCGGFSCVNLSVAGDGTGLDETTEELNTSTMTYLQLRRFVDALRPETVVLENTPVLLASFRDVIERDFRARGYDSIVWVRCRARDAGAPHIRARVFVLIRRSGPSMVVTAPDDGAWRARPWPTPNASNPNEGDTVATWQARQALNIARLGKGFTEPLALAVRPWPTSTAADAKASGASAYSTESGRHAGTTLTDAAVRFWATPQPGKRLNPAWVETLVGLPIGWTDTTGKRLHVERRPDWPRGRYPADWDRRIPWPGHDWEPGRTLSDGQPARGRPARLRALGNIAMPQQVALALETALDPQQLGLFA